MQCTERNREWYQEHIAGGIVSYRLGILLLCYIQWMLAVGKGRPTNLWVRPVQQQKEETKDTESLSELQNELSTKMTNLLGGNGHPQTGEAWERSGSEVKLKP